MITLQSILLDIFKRDLRRNKPTHLHPPSEFSDAFVKRLTCSATLLYIKEQSCRRYPLPSCLLELCQYLHREWFNVPLKEYKICNISFLDAFRPFYMLKVNLILINKSFCIILGCFHFLLTTGNLHVLQTLQLLSLFLQMEYFISRLLSCADDCH